MVKIEVKFGIDATKLSQYPSMFFDPWTLIGHSKAVSIVYAFYPYQNIMSPFIGDLFQSINLFLEKNALFRIALTLEIQYEPGLVFNGIGTGLKSAGSTPWSKDGKYFLDDFGYAHSRTISADGVTGCRAVNRSSTLFQFCKTTEKQRGLDFSVYSPETQKKQNQATVGHLKLNSNK